MSESQYAHYKDLPRQPLGVMANQVWLDDPKMLGIRLARYKFVSKMLAGKNKVAEIGCGDGWFSRVVAKEVGALFLFDFDKTFIDDFCNSDCLPNMGAYVHDILDAPLEHGKYDAAYSLDCFEHIAPENADAYLNNICASLVDKGVFICGMPSLESQAYASPASKFGHVNNRSYDDLKKKLEDFFSQVFMFGMNDEMVHCGFGHMCQYLIGLCICPK